MIYTVTLTPALDKTVTVPFFSLDKVNRIASMQLDAGGKGINVSRWVHMLGEKTMALGILGGGAGRFIEKTLTQDKIETSFIWVDAETRTNIKVIDPENGTQTDINEPGAPVRAEVLGAVYDTLRKRVREGDIVVFAGKTPPGTPDTLLPDWVEAMNALGAKTIVDMDGPALSATIARGPYLIKPNQEELEAMLGSTLDSEQDAADAARELLASGIARVVISRGAKGAVFAIREQILAADGLEIQVGSTVGAGDATVAALAYGEAKGMAFADIVPLAIAAGAASAMQTGTQVAEKQLVMELAKRVKIREIYHSGKKF